MNAPAAPNDEAARRAGLPPGSRLHEIRLASGLWLAAAEVPTARMQRMVGAVGVGYLDEPDDCRGLAHLLEHALFLGSARFPGPESFTRWVGERGGRYNAHTDETVTDVHLQLPPTETDEGLARLVDMLARPQFEAERIGHEVGVLDAEFHARLADPALHRLMALGRLCREGHPARQCHAGNRKSLGDDVAHLVARLSDFHTQHYRTGCMALTMLGPLPLEEQLALLERYGDALPMDEVRPPIRPWRWAEPGGVAWHPPQATAEASVLEVFWPLPDELAATHRERLNAVAARLLDGKLAATLQAAIELDRLEVTLAPGGTGASLTLRLAPVPDGETLQTLFAVCRQALERALATPLYTPSSPPIDLDAWPRQHACRLVGTEDRCNPPDASEEELLPWLAPEQCRLLWLSPDTPGSWKHMTETGTAWRLESLPQENVPLPWRAPPTLATRPIPSSAGDATPRQLCQGAGFKLWAGDPVRLADAPSAALCLGWPTPASPQAAYLSQWRQNALPLRQAAQAHGLQLSCDGDARCTWLIAMGEAERLAALAELALASWPQKAPKVPERPYGGLLAQRMLSRLETLPPPDAADGKRPQPLGWVYGNADAQAAETLLRRLAARRRNDETTHEPPATTHRLPPQGSDHAVMLEVVGPDDTPRSRWLLQLLAQCHDAAFHREMRQRRGLGYAAAVRYRESAGFPRLGYVVQSPGTDVVTLRQAILEFIDQQSEALAHLTIDDLTRRQRGLLANAGPPEIHAEAMTRLWQALRRQAFSSHPMAAWQPLPWVAEAQALASLSPDELGALAHALATGGLARSWWLHSPTEPLV
ncbi:MAG: insulinase family protein [Halomonas sp.]|nr:insulinase family protein [Halomonas sp.]MCC5884298.1 insulinase family protein [Halomonas sp.]